MAYALSPSLHVPPVKITSEVKAAALEWAERRCECAGGNCRHHLSGSRCKHGLRGDEWKVYWRSERAGPTRENIEAWCLQCFDNNFEVPRESVALLAVDLAEYAALLSENRRQAITLKSTLRDIAERIATAHKGRLVLDRIDDDILMEFPKGRHAVQAAQTLQPAFRELVERLKLPVPPIRGGIHYGEVTRWRNGILVGEAVDVVADVVGAASGGEIMVSEPAVPMIRIGLDLEPTDKATVEETASVPGLWAIKF